MNVAPTRPGPVRWGWTHLATFAALVCLYLVWHGRQYDTEATKQAMWNASGPSVGAVNHAWSSVWYWYWWRAVAPLAGDDFDTRMFWMTSLNALLSAGSVILLMDTLRVSGVSRPAAVGAGLLLGGAADWFHQSSQPMEPMMAEFWLLLSVRLSLSGERFTPVTTAAAAVCWACSVAAYQSFLFAGLGLLVLVATSRRRAFCWLGVAVMAGTTLTLLAAIGHGASSSHDVVVYITTKADANYWGAFHLAAAAQTLLGLVNAISPPWPVAGWRGLREGWGLLSTGAKAYLVVHVLAWGGAIILALGQRPRPPQRRLYAASFLIFLGGLFFPFYLLPYYSKLWLMPLGGLALLVGLAASRGRFACGLLYCFIGWMLLRNTVQVYEHWHRADNPQQLAARALEKAVGPDDLLVCDGWDYSNLYLTRNPTHPRFAVMYDSKEPKDLDTLVDSYRLRGARVLFFGLLEQSPEQWAANDSGKRGTTVPYESIQAYKPKARLVWRGSERGFVGDLYELTAP